LESTVFCPNRNRSKAIISLAELEVREINTTNLSGKFLVSSYKSMCIAGQH
jgi:hypothetical protein